MTRVRFCLVPGYVYSMHDHDRHYVGTGQLANLYNLANGQFVSHKYNRACDNLVHLEVRYDGRYFDANERFPET